ncbi:MAG: flagellar basal-body rod protein FlgF [Myxococcota bacterium]
MGNGIYVAMSGAVAQDRALDVVANNVANARTNAYKAERIAFDEVLNEKGELSYVDVDRGAVDETRGSMVTTDNPLDLALDGDGWFSVQTPQGTRYTRDGAFSLNDGGVLVDGAGNSVRGAGGAEIVVPPDAADVSIDAEGFVYAGDDPIGQLEVVRFDGGQLTREGANLFRAQGRPVRDELPAVVSGHLESSNFNTVRGMVDLVRISRTYESLHRMIENYRQVDQRTARDIGSPR